MGTSRWMSPSTEAQHTPNSVLTVLPPAPNYREEPALKFLVGLVPLSPDACLQTLQVQHFPAVLCWDVITVICLAARRGSGDNSEGYSLGCGGEASVGAYCLRRNGAKKDDHFPSLR